MYNYVLSEGNTIVVKDGENKVGELSVSIQNNKAWMEIVEMPEIKEGDFGSYFNMMTQLTDGVKSLLKVDEVVWGNIESIKDFDVYASSMSKSAQQPSASRK